LQEYERFGEKWKDDLDLEAEAMLKKAGEVYGEGGD